ncbi:MAG: hypothetical protein ABIP78_11170 [Pyrinomonadaceae bacterium]
MSVYLMRNNTHHDRKRITLLKYIYAKAAPSGQGIAEIGGEFTNCTAASGLLRSSDIAIISV